MIKLKKSSLNLALKFDPKLPLNLFYSFLKKGLLIAFIELVFNK